MPRFKSALKERYDWAEADLEAEWTAAQSNPRAVWSKDDYGVPVVSLLRSTTASTGRELQHHKEISKQNQTLAIDDDLEEAMTSSFAFASA